MAISRAKNRVNYLVTYFLIAFSGIPFFDANRLLRFGFLLILGALFLYYKRKLNKEILYISVIALILILIQTIFWGGKVFSSINLVALLIFVPYFAVKVIGPQFLKYFRTVFYYMSVISIMMWAGTNFIPGFHMLTYKIALVLFPFTPWPIPESLIIYTVGTEEVLGLVRNPGSLHEPGAHSVFLVLGILAEIFTEKKLITKRNLIFFANLVTTFSTAGFLSMFVIVGFYVFTSKRMTPITKYVVLVSILGLIVYLFTTLEFLGDKLADQVENQTEVRLHEETSGRFLGFRKALIVLGRYPLWGRGLLTSTKAEADSEEAAGYGWITWMSRIGLLFGTLYMFYLYRAMWNYSVMNLNSRLFSWFAFIALLGVLAAQKHTSAIVFFMIFLMPIIFPYNKYAEEYYLKPK